MDTREATAVGRSVCKADTVGQELAAVADHRRPGRQARRGSGRDRRGSSGQKHTEMGLAAEGSARMVIRIGTVFVSTRKG